MVHAVKTILNAMSPAFKFNDESLRSALFEIEFIIRLLTFVALDSADIFFFMPKSIEKSISQYQYFSLTNRPTHMHAVNKYIHDYTVNKYIHEATCTLLR